MTTKNNLITVIRDGNGLCRTVAGIVTFSVLWLSVFPSLVAAQELSEGGRHIQGSADASSENQLNAVLVELEATIRNQSEKGDWKAVEKIESEMRELDTKIMSSFDDIAATIDEKELPETIVDRHNSAVAEYQVQLSSLFIDIDNIRKETDSEKRAKSTIALADRLGSIKKKRSQQKENLDSLPSRSLRPKPENLPKITMADFILDDPIGDRRNLVASVEPPVPSGDDAFLNPDWLSESDEVELTQAIIDKATELNNDPVAIYHWVRNSIRWNPNWGAKQTAQLTLELESGNALDISSLTIALMRAAGTPARYVHGTIDVPEEQFRNWAGGFESVISAANFGASGGIPITGITSGGQIAKVRMEHVWVEVAVDYVPSRASKNLVADSWIPIDPSFKRYIYTDRLNQLPITGVDTDAVGQDLVDSGVINSADGSISGLDTGILEAVRLDSTDAIEAYIASNLPNGTLGDLFGSRTTIEQAFPTLSDSLPNKIVVEGARYASIPDALQQKMRFGLGTNEFGQIDNFISLPWAAVNNRKITLTFTPATSDDVAVLDALIPDGELTDASQLPSSIPAYLIDVVPELRLDDQVIASGPAIPLGEELVFHFNPTIAGLGELAYNYSVIAGSYLSVAAIGNDVSEAVFDTVEARLAQTGIDLAGPPVVSSVLQRDEIMGDLFYSGLLGYYTAYNAYAEFLGAGNRDQHQLAAGLGSIGYEPKVETLFGVPRSLSPGAAFGDLPLVRVIGVNDSGNGERVFSSNKDFNFALGLVGSALEHGVAEFLFEPIVGSTPNATSAIKALNIASDEGQRIFQISQTNLDIAVVQINQSAEILAEISGAVSRGLEVIIHTDPISNAGFVGAGYILFDPVTGDGAYKISGGANGFFIVLLIAFVVVLLSLAIHVIAVGSIFNLAGFLLAYELTAYFSWLSDLKKAGDDAELINTAHSTAAFLMVLPFLWEAGAAAGVSAGTLSALSFGAIITKIIAIVAGL